MNSSNYYFTLPRLYFTLLWVGFTCIITLLHYHSFRSDSNEVKIKQPGEMNLLLYFTLILENYY